MAVRAFRPLRDQNALRLNTPLRMTVLCGILRLVLTVKKISSLDAADYGRYLAGRDRTIEGMDRSPSLRRGDYYLGSESAVIDSEQQVGGASWFGVEDDLRSWGMSGEIDSKKLTRLMRGQHAQDTGRFVYDEARDKWLPVADGTPRADLKGQRVERQPLRVRAAGSALDPVSLRSAIEDAVAERGGWRELDRATWDAAMVALHGDVHSPASLKHNIGHRRHDGLVLDEALRGNDGAIKELAKPCEQVGLVKLKEHRRAVVNSQDLTFSVPKSVSLAWAAAGPRERALIEEAVVSSSQHALEYITTTTNCVKVKRDGVLEYEGARGAVGASFVHHSARSAHGSIPDPQLHVHNLLVGVKRSDGKLVTPDQAELVRHGREGGAYFRCALASRLQELGLEIEGRTGKQGRYFELAGVAKEAVEKFSGRTRELREFEADWVRKYGRDPSPAERAKFAMRSRAAKGVETTEQLSPAWARELARHDLGQSTVRRMFGAGRGRERNVAADVARVEQLALDAMEQAGSIIRDREARSIILECSAGVLSPQLATALVEDMQRRGMIVALQDGRVTTKRLRDMEQQVLAAVDRQIAVPGIDPETIRRAVAQVETRKGFKLSQEQLDAVAVGCSSSAVTTIVGVAGSGKGVAITAISEATRQAGYGVVASAVMGKRAMEAGEQAEAGGFSIDGIRTGNFVVTEGTQGHVRERELRAGDVIIVDEAGMVDTPRFQMLVEAAETAGARLVLVGDPEQLPPVGAGGMFEQFVEHAPSSELKVVHRTDVAWLRDAQLAIREGRAQDAVQLMVDHDALHMLHTNRQAMERMVNDWDTWRHDYPLTESLLIVHTSNDDVDRVNELAQHKRIVAGELEGASVRAADRAYHLHVGEPVIFRDSSYMPPGERLVRNGTRGMIVGVDERDRTVDVRIHEPNHAPRVVTVHLDQMGEASLRLMYASHVMPSQGETIQRTAELSGHWSTNKEASYVGASRHRRHHEMYVSRQALGLEGSDHDRLERLAERMNERGSTRASLTLETEKRAIGRAVVLNDFDRAMARYEATAAKPPAERVALLKAVQDAALTSPPPLVLHTLGRRPSDAEARVRWDAAARELVGFHARHSTLRGRTEPVRRVEGDSRARDAHARMRDTCRRAQRELQQRNQRVRFTYDLAQHGRGRGR